MLTNGDTAPDFTAIDQHGIYQTLADYKGKWVLLYFYPKDDTPGCTMEACSFRDNYAILSEKLTILGVSADSADSHAAFTEKYALPFSLLVDQDKSLITKYEAGGFFPKRVSFLINPEGKIAKIYPKVDPKTHATDIIHDINEWMK